MVSPVLFRFFLVSQVMGVVVRYYVCRAQIGGGWMKAGEGWAESAGWKWTRGVERNQTTVNVEEVKACRSKYSGIVTLDGGKKRKKRGGREASRRRVDDGVIGRWLILHTLFYFMYQVCRAFSFLYQVHYNEMVSFRCIFEVIRVVYLLPIPPSSSLSLVSTSRINSCFVTKQHPHFCCLARG